MISGQIWLISFFFKNDDFLIENKQNWLISINYGNRIAFVFAKCSWLFDDFE